MSEERQPLPMTGFVLVAFIAIATLASIADIVYSNKTESINCPTCGGSGTVLMTNKIYDAMWYMTCYPSKKGSKTYHTASGKPFTHSDCGKITVTTNAPLTPPEGKTLCKSCAKKLKKNNLR